MECVNYIRWSSTEQSKGSSLERQRSECRAHAERHGWSMKAEIVDDGVSAFKGRHASEGNLARFVEDVEAGRYPNGVVLLVEKLDRLSREEPGRVFVWMLNLTEAGVVIATVDGDRQYRRGTFDMASIIEVVVKAQLAHEESEKKATRLAAAWASKRAKVERGEKIVMTRRAPAWLDVVGSPREFVLIEDRAQVVRRIFEDTAAGYGKHHIAKRLNEEGVPTFGRASGWHSSYIQKILSSPTVLGDMQPGAKPRGEPRVKVGEPIRNYYPAVVDADLHARALASMSGRRRIVTGRGRRLVNLFAGIAKCASCGSKMTFRGKGRKVRANGIVVNEDYLVCDSYQRGRGCTNGVHFNYVVWQNGILDGILESAIGDRHFASPVIVQRLEIEIAQLERERATADEQAATALGLFVETSRQETKDLWLRLVAENDQRKAAIVQLRRDRSAAAGVIDPAEHRRRITELREALDDADDDVRFAARAKVMDATHDLVARMTFSGSPFGVEIDTTDERTVAIALTDHGTDVTIWDGPA